MSSYDSSLKRIGEIAKSLGIKRKKDHMVICHERMSQAYFRFLQAMAKNALILTSAANDSSDRKINLQTCEIQLAQSGSKSLEDPSTGNFLVLEQDECKDLRDMIKGHMKMEREAQEALNNMFISSLVSCFEVYIQDLLYEIFVRYPKTLRCNKALTYDEILKHSSIAQVISYMAQLESSKSTEGFATEYLFRMAKRFGINAIEELINKGIIKEGIEKVTGIRNVIVHSGGVVDSAYLRRYPQSSFQEGDCILLDLDDVSGISERIRLTVDIIESSARQKFKSIAVTEWSAQSEIYLDYILGLEEHAE
jgi:hypothetical protein